MDLNHQVAALAQQIRDLQAGFDSLTGRVMALENRPNPPPHPPYPGPQPREDNFKPGDLLNKVFRKEGN